MPRSSPGAELRARGGLRRLDLSLLVFGLLLATLLVLVVNPLARLVWDSLHSATGDWSLHNYADTLGKARPVKAMLMSMGLGGAVTVIALALGVPLALGVSRTNMPARGYTHLSVMAAFVMPPFLGAIAWILLAGPNAGWLNRAWLAVFGGEHGPFKVFSFWGLAFVIALYAFPLVYVFTRSALDLISSEMEEAAAIQGAGKLMVLRKVTLPLALPAMLGAAILVFLESVALYG
ncbi:MAG: ABC transporter permease subunit, partial [Pseudomonadota bacterium]|nr:ABC transporter permease subunit [Pseudomonadota bacterium]